MVEAHGIDGIETAQIVAVRGEVAVPRNHIEGRMFELRRPQPSGELLHELAARGTILEIRTRDLEVARGGKTVGAGVVAKVIK